MKKKRILILFLAMILAFAIAGCNGKNKVDKKDTEVSGDVSENESVLENENVTENKVTEETQKTDNTTTNAETNKNNTTTNKNESTSNKNETTGNNNTTTKPSTGSTTKPSAGSNNTTTKPSTSSTNNSGSTGNTQNDNGGTTTQPSTPVHEHNWVEVTEEVKHYYDWRSICGKCGTDLTDMTSDDRILHVGMVCGGRYSVKLVEVDYVTENVQKETIVTGYKCECGATKNK